MIGIGLLYRRGYFRQRLDITGRQQEYWIDSDPHGLPMARVTTPEGGPLLLEVHAVRRPAAVPGLAGRRRPDPAAPARRRAALERRGAAVDLGAPVRGEPGRAARAVRAARDRRRAGAPGARDRPGRDPSERGTSGAGGAGARGGGDRARCPARRGVRERPPEVRLHHAHPRCGRERDVCARRVPARVRGSPRAARAQRRGVPRPLPRCARRERPAGDDAARDQDEPPPERREPAPRRGLAAHVAAALSRLGRIPDHACHERRPRADVRLRADPAAARAPSRRRVAARPGRCHALGRRPRDPERRALGGPLRGAAASRRLPPGEVRPGQPAARRAARVREADRDEPRPGRAHDRLRAAARDLQALPPAQLRRRSAPAGSSPATSPPSS